MLFSFLKYIKGTWYFNLKPKGLDIPYFVDFEKLNEEEKCLLKLDDEYSSLEAKIADAAYQLWHLGLVKIEPEYSIYSAKSPQVKGEEKLIHIDKGKTITLNQDIFINAIDDNYRFMRRYFNPIISWYIFLIRLLSLKNPFVEFGAFKKTMRIKRIDFFKDSSGLSSESQIDSCVWGPNEEKPLVTVIIPTLNRYSYLKDVLADLEKQDYKNFEVIVCDQSDDFNEEFYKEWNLSLKLIRQEEKALCKARNSAMFQAKGDFILLFDDDSRVKNDWIIQHLRCIYHFKADISSGISIDKISEMIPPHYSVFRWADQLDTGNVMIRKQILAFSGLLDRQFEGQTNEDAEFGLRLFLLGFKAISNPLAQRLHLKASTGGMREMSGWDSLRPRKVFAPRPVPSLLYLSRKYFGDHMTFLMLLFTLPGAIIPYKHKNKSYLKAVAAIFIILIIPLLFFQVILSWSISNRKLKAGSLIDYF